MPKPNACQVFANSRARLAWDIKRLAQAAERASGVELGWIAEELERLAQDAQGIGEDSKVADAEIEADHE